MTETSVQDLTVAVSATSQQILSRVSMKVESGEIHGLAGETGSGKTTLGLAFLGYLAHGLHFRSGTISSAGASILSDGNVLAKDPLRSLRGEVISYVPQDPSSALNPGMRIGASFKEVLHAHGITDRDEQDRRIASLLESVGLPSQQTFIQRFPHQLSGGQLQRVGIAIAFSLSPAVVVMDEPTTGLDVSTKNRIASLVRGLAKSTGTAIIFVSHDLRLLLEISDTVSVLFDGQIVDQGTPAQLIHGVVQPYTRKLLDALPTIKDSVRPISDQSAGSKRSNQSITVDGLSARYGSTTATHEVSFTLHPGHTLAIVGESGSGKTTLARCIAGFHTDYSGQILLGGERLEPSIKKRTREQKAAVQYVFQNPFGSLNPTRRVGHSIALAAKLLARQNRIDAEQTARTWLSRVGLENEHFDALPAHLSGGQRQRVALARALAATPSVLVCDEVTSSLDVSVQREIVGLLQEIQEEEELAMLFITHDLALANWIAHDTVVLLDGRIVEQGTTFNVLNHPKREYTQSLVEAGRY